jgi:hypothetical protein
MSPYPCSREKEVAAALKGGQWPNGCEAEVRDHVAGCARCSDLVLVAQSLQAARAGAMSLAASRGRLEAPGVLWWRAQLRRRSEAVERIGKPISRAQGFALVVNLLLLAGLAASQAGEIGRGLKEIWESGAPQAGDYALSILASVQANLSPMLLISGAGVLVLAGGVAWLVATEK